MSEAHEQPSELSEVIFFGPSEFAKLFQHEVVQSTGISLESIAIQAGISHYTPNEKSNPTVGTRGDHQAEPEVKITAIIPTSALDGFAQRVCQIHPYESFVIEVYQDKKQKLPEDLAGDARITLHVPSEQTEQARQALAETGVGTIGPYTDCSFVIQNGPASSIETIDLLGKVREASALLQETLPYATIEVIPFTQPGTQNGRVHTERLLSQKEAELLLEATRRLNLRLHSNT